MAWPEPIWVLNAVLWGLLLVIVYFDLIDDGSDDKE